MTPANFALTFVVVGFWAAILVHVRRRTRTVSLNLVVMPLAFEILGIFVNRYHPWWGTYSVAAIHVLLLAVLLSRTGRGK